MTSQHYLQVHFQSRTSQRYNPTDDDMKTQKDNGLQGRSTEHQPITFKD